jgi:hypothetical protein
MKSDNMKKVIPLIVYLCFAWSAAYSQSDKEKDVAAIKAMCGCYEVNFNFAETFNYVDDPEYKPSPVKRTGGLEWVQLVEEDDEKIVLQHLLVVGPKDNQHVIKHWRQDWEYENRDFYMFSGDNSWTYERKSKEEVTGEWTQKVFQVDDSPRYEGSAPWIHIDGKSYWENTTNAPLPRREYTIRSDYNITVRQNRHEITENGWIHDQDNKKVLREDGDDTVIAEEKGFNSYTKVDPSRCQAAQDWWAANHDMWSTVRDNWASVFAKKKSFTLKPKVDNKRLYEHLFAMDPADAASKEIEQVITGFVIR